MPAEATDSSAAVANATPETNGHELDKRAETAQPKSVSEKSVQEDEQMDKATVVKPKFLQEQSDDGDVEDHFEIARRKCATKAKCKAHAHELDECTARVIDHPDTPETCEEELMELMHCVDHCAIHEKHLFSKLK